MTWLVIALIWFAVSMSVASIIGRAIRFGMTGERHPPIETETVYPNAELTTH